MKEYFEDKIWYYIYSILIFNKNIIFQRFYIMKPICNYFFITKTVKIIVQINFPIIIYFQILISEIILYQI